MIEVEKPLVGGLKGISDSGDDLMNEAIQDKAKRSTKRFNNNQQDDEMFDSNMLLAVNLPEYAPQLPDDLLLRPLRITDYHRGYLQLLSQLTAVGNVTEEQFRRRFRSMQNTDPKSYYIVVIEDLNSGAIVGSATLVVEYKFIHSAGCRGRTEDVVVSREMRGRQLGKLLNYYLVEMARELGVYKMSLECKDKLITFYEQFGFVKDAGNNFMVQRFESSTCKI